MLNKAKFRLPKSFGGFSVTWTGDLEKKVSEFPSRLLNGINAYMDYNEEVVTNYMKLNAPWTDQTSNARNSLSARNASNPPIYRLVCAHGVPYGIWLEVRFNGKYAIVIPTIQHEGERIMASIQKVVRRL